MCNLLLMCKNVEMLIKDESYKDVDLKRTYSKQTKQTTKIHVSIQLYTIYLLAQTSQDRVAVWTMPS